MAQKVLKTYKNFTGGLVESVSPDDMADNELVQADNIDLDERGGFSWRKGTDNFNTTYGAGNVECLIEWPRNNGTKVLLGIYGTTLVKIAEAGTKTDILELNSADIGYFFFQDNFYVIDGDDYYVYNGTSIKKARPEIELTGVVGTFEVAETITGGTSGATAVIDVIDGTTIGVSSIVGTFQLAETITGGTSAATGSIDSKVDGINPTNNIVPIKKCKYLAYHPKSYRFFATGNSDDPTALYYSEANEPDYWKETSVLYPTTADGPTTGLFIFGNSMLCWFQESIWAWKGIDPSSDAEWIKLPSHVGTVSNRSIVMTPGTITFLAQDGIYSLNPAILNDDFVIFVGDQLITKISERKLDNTIKAMTNKNKACAVFREGKYLLSYCDTGSNNNKVLIYNWGLKAFTRYIGWNVIDWCSRSNGDLLFGSTAGLIKKTEQGYNDADVAYTCTVMTKPLGLEQDWVSTFHKKKTFLFLLAAKQIEEPSKVNIKIKADYKEDYYSIDLNESFVWGNTSWGTSWGWIDLITKEIEYYQKAMRYQITFTNSTKDMQGTIYGVGFLYKPKKARGNRSGITIGW